MPSRFSDDKMATQVPRRFLFDDQVIREQQQSNRRVTIASAKDFFNTEQVKTLLLICSL